MNHSTMSLERVSGIARRVRSARRAYNPNVPKPPASPIPVPAPRLVGVEPNPGPPKRARKPVKVVQTLTISKARNKRPNSQLARQGPNRALSFLRGYQSTLMDPWEYAGVKMGYDCFTATSLMEGYTRGSFVVNADGSFGLVFQPSVKLCLCSQTAGATVATWSGASDMVNAAYIVQSSREARVVSAGIRLIAAVASTAAPGVLFGATAGDMTMTDMTALTPTTLSQLPGALMGIGATGVQLTSRPLDNASFEFFTNNLTGYATNAIPYNTSCMIAGLNFPANTRVYFEAVINIEAIPISSAAALGPSSAESSDSLAGTAASYFPSPETLVSAAKAGLRHPIVLNAALMAADAVGVGSAARVALGVGANYLGAQARGPNRGPRIEELVGGQWVAA